MLTLPGNLTASSFWRILAEKAAVHARPLRSIAAPSISRNELAWLATLDDVESRIVFWTAGGDARYRVETALSSRISAALPKRDWTCWCTMSKSICRRCADFSAVPFIPDWRIDDLMVSFARPAAASDRIAINYDVFLCQGIGVRNWRFTTADDRRRRSAATTSPC